jgi:transposase-like protein
MVKKPIHCPNCLSFDVVKYGETPDGKQRFLCKNSNCSRQTFILDYSYKGHLPEVKEQIIEMTLNSSGIRDISRVLQISPTTVINELKKITRVTTSQ